MRDLRELDQYRRKDATFSPRISEDKAGAFDVPYDKVVLLVLASVEAGWDHVSVSLPHRCPSWHEMSHVQRLYFKPDEDAMQLHVPIEDHVNCHPTCLHLWRPIFKKIPRPPAHLVGGERTETRRERRVRASNLRYR